MRKQKRSNKRKQTGFSSVKLLVVVGVIMVIGMIATIIYAVTQKKTEEPKPTDQASQTFSPDAVESLTADWVTYVNDAGKYSLKYPNSWVVPPNRENCSPELFLVASNRIVLGQCASSFMGQMYVTSVAGDKSADYVMKDEAYSEIKSENLTVDGQGGSRQSGTSKGTGSGEMEIVAEGVEVVLYTFYVPPQSRTYIARYEKRQKPRYPDVLSNFDLMIKNTLKFKTE